MFLDCETVLWNGELNRQSFEDILPIEMVLWSGEDPDSSELRSLIGKS